MEKKNKIIIHAVLFILGQSSQIVSLQSGTVQGKDRATCDAQPPSLCVPLRGNQKLSASTAPPGQQGGADRNTQHDPSLSCYSQASRCCQLQWQMLPAQPVASLTGCPEPGRFVIAFPLGWCGDCAACASHAHMARAHTEGCMAGWSIV